MDDSFINEPNKNRQGIRETADNWYIKMQAIEPENARNQIIIDELEEVIVLASAWKDFANIRITDDSETKEPISDTDDSKKIKELISDTHKRKISALAYLYKGMVEQFLSDDTEIKFVGGTQITELEKKYRIILYDWLNIYRDVFILWFFSFKIIPAGHFLDGTKIRHIEVNPFLESDDKKSSLSVDDAKKIACKLITNNFIDCNTDDFAWYFCGEQNRANKSKPAPLKWIGKKNAFAYFGYLISWKVSYRYRGCVPWKQLLLIFDGIKFGEKAPTEKSLATTENEIKNLNKGRNKPASNAPTLFTGTSAR